MPRTGAVRHRSGLVVADRRAGSTELDRAGQPSGGRAGHSEDERRSQVAATVEGAQS